MKDKIKKELTEKSKSVYHDYGHFAIEFEQLTPSGARLQRVLI